MAKVDTLAKKLMETEGLTEFKAYERAMRELGIPPYDVFTTDPKTGKEVPLKGPVWISDGKGEFIEYVPDEVDDEE